MSSKWYTDTSAALFYQKFKDALDPLLVEVAPYHELTHIGVQRDPISDKFELRLHFAPIGTVRVKPEEQGDPLAIDRPKPAQEQS